MTELEEWAFDRQEEDEAGAVDRRRIAILWRAGVAEIVVTGVRGFSAVTSRRHF